MVKDDMNSAEFEPAGGFANGLNEQLQNYVSSKAKGSAPVQLLEASGRVSQINSRDVRIRLSEK